MYNRVPAPSAQAIKLLRKKQKVQPYRLFRWDEIALEKVTEMVSRKIVSGTREMVAQHYLKKGALVPVHAHESEQMTYVLQGALRALVNGDEVIVREGEILHVPPLVPHQAEAIEDTFTLDLFCPIRAEWLDQPAQNASAGAPAEEP